MPIRIKDHLPAAEILKRENIFIMPYHQAEGQDIRPLNIAVLNLMPKKIEAETQILRLLGNSPLQVEIELLKTGSYQSKNTPEEHLLEFYKTFDQVKERRFDGLVVTGAPIELMKFEDVDYWDELVEILEWARTHVFSTLGICWGSQALLYHYYGIKKFTLPKKLYGVYDHRVIDPYSKLTRGFDEHFFAPHSRYTDIRREDVLKEPDLRILADSDEAGVYLMASQDLRRVFVTGHPEYDRQTLLQEYQRDLAKGLDIHVPENYFLHNNPALQPRMNWRSHANLLLVNWLNYAVYQETPYELESLG